MFTCMGRDSITSSDSQRICHLNKSLLQGKLSLPKELKFRIKKLKFRIKNH